MKPKYKYIIAILFLSAVLHAQDNAGSSDIFVKIGNKTISSDEFIRRAEYTIRPPYCKGDGGIDKKIILNSLITEKLLAIEAEKKDDNIYKRRFFSDFIKGRREQLMRQLLAYNEGTAKVILDSTEIKQEYINSCKTYKAGFIVLDTEQAEVIAKRIKNGETFEKIYREYTGYDSVQAKEIEWKNPENENIRKALFSSSLKVNDIVGPVEVSDTTSIILKIQGWKEKILLTDTEIRQRFEDVKEKLTAKKGEKIYSGFITSLMQGKDLELNKDIYPKLLRATDQYYILSANDKKDAFLDLSFEKQNSKGLFTENIEEIREEPIFKFDEKVWTVEDLENEMRSHPLVFRKKKFTRKEFPEQLKMAIADLLRDKYLTAVGYQRKYDSNEFVSRQTNMWEDASAALYEKYSLLETADTTGKGWLSVMEEYLNPLSDSLLKKYSPVIEINTDILNKIKLTRTDLVTLETGVPYPVYVPSFPTLTTKNKIDYGRKLE